MALVQPSKRIGGHLYHLQVPRLLREEESQAIAEKVRSGGYWARVEKVGCDQYKVWSRRI